MKATTLLVVPLLMILLTISVIPISMYYNISNTYTDTHTTYDPCCENAASSLADKVYVRACIYGNDPLYSRSAGYAYGEIEKYIPYIP